MHELLKMLDSPRSFAEFLAGNSGCPDCVLHVEEQRASCFATSLLPFHVHGSTLKGKQP
ncbi:hypothetical protein P4238_12210 [Pseudomonas aeruginosa]|nr:hypothetical protein [Pseudomonas aeruginosa]